MDNKIIKTMLGDGREVDVGFISDWSNEVITYGDTLADLRLRPQHGYSQALSGASWTPAHRERRPEPRITGIAREDYFDVYCDGQIAARLDYENIGTLTYGGRFVTATAKNSSLQLLRVSV